MRLISFTISSGWLNMTRWPEFGASIQRPLANAAAVWRWAAAMAGRTLRSKQGHLRARDEADLQIAQVDRLVAQLGQLADKRRQFGDHRGCGLFRKSPHCGDRLRYPPAECGRPGCRSGDTCRTGPAAAREPIIACRLLPEGRKYRSQSERDPRRTGISHAGFEHDRRVSASVNHIMPPASILDRVEMSNFKTSGNLHSTAADLLQWDRCLQRRTVPLVAPATLDLMFSSHAVVDDGRSYGYGLSVDSSSRGHGGHLPGYWSKYRYFPENKATVIMLSNHDLSWKAISSPERRGCCEKGRAGTSTSRRHRKPKRLPRINSTAFASRHGNSLYYETSFSPVTPTIIRAKLTSRAALLDSPKKIILISTAPAVPIPIQTA